MLHLLKKLILISSALFTSVSIAGTYVCVDDYGNKIYTDKKNSSGTCTISQLETLNTYSANLSKVVKKNSVTKKNKNVTKIRYNQPNSVHPNTMVSKKDQIKRDFTRRVILSNELKNELQALAKIRDKIHQLRLQNSTVSIQQLKQQANEHQQNIDVINKELSRI